MFLGRSQIFNTKIATQTCAIPRGVWNFRHKLNLYLIINFFLGWVTATQTGRKTSSKNGPKITHQPHPEATANLEIQTLDQVAPFFPMTLLTHHPPFLPMLQLASRSRMRTMESGITVPMVSTRMQPTLSWLTIPMHITIRCLDIILRVNLHHHFSGSIS